MWAKIGLGLVIAVAIVACSLVDGVSGGTCTAGSEICDFCAVRNASNNACGNNDPRPCGDDWSCVRGPTSSCGLEFSMMLDHFRANPQDCFDPQNLQASEFFDCQPDAGGPGCFQN